MVTVRGWKTDNVHISVTHGQFQHHHNNTGINVTGQKLVLLVCSSKQSVDCVSAPLAALDFNSVHLVWL